MDKPKVKKVMQEFKAGKLKSSSGSKVTNPKQAIAIGLSEQSRKDAGKAAARERRLKGKAV